MPKSKKVTSENSPWEQYAIMCPACKYQHIFTTRNPEREKGGPQWGFNYDLDKPTFTPSMLLTTGSYADPNYVDDPMIPPERCHSFVTDGKIQFLCDCTHELKNQTVDLPEID